MTKRGGKIQREARKLQRATGVRYTEALAQVQRVSGVPDHCPECGGYDLGTTHEGVRAVQACNECSWIDR